MKILWVGPVFHPTGIATAAREMIKALIKRGNQVQVQDPYNSKYDFSEGLENVNNAIDIKDLDATFVYDYPQFWRAQAGKVVNHFIHEGTMLWPDWIKLLNESKGVLAVACKANKNMFRWNGVNKDMSIINYGVSEIYQPMENKPVDDEFVFLSVNSWTGEIGDRKGTELLIKAFNEEFKEEENVKLLLKISTFWEQQDAEFYAQKIINLTGKANTNILFDSQYRDEKELVTFYQRANCFVAPTRGEGFGLTILNALACGLPVIVTKDNNSGHMDFCKGNPNVFWIDAPTSIQGDRRFYVEGNMLAEPDFEHLKKQMRFVYENRKELKTEEGCKMAREHTWDKTAKQIEEIIDGNKKT